MSDESDLSSLSDADSVDDIIARFQREDSNSGDEEGMFDIESDAGEDVDDDDEDEEEDDDREEDDTDDDEEEYTGKRPLFPSKYEILAKKDEMASDLEDSDDEDEESGLPDAMKWGSKKADYYNTDYVDSGRRHKIDARDEGKAAAEEAEAISIQKRLMSEMKDVDLGFDFFGTRSNEKVMSVSAVNDADVDDDENDEDEEDGPIERVKMNTAGLSEREKEQLLHRLHPELISILKDFKSCLKEAAEILVPIVDYSQANESDESVLMLKSVSGFQIITLRYRLVKENLQTITHYLNLKSRSVDVKKHPITRHLFQLKKLMHEVDQIMEKNGLKEAMKSVARKIKLHQPITLTKKSSGSTSESTTVSSETDQLLQEIDIPDDLLLEARNTLIAAGEMNDAILNRNNNNHKTGAGDDSNNATASSSQGTERRHVTGEMEKNRGMTAARKKEIKNPRVKHRLKYAKALVRRKGQVREPRKPINKYAGEISGIKGHQVRSIKFKH